MQCQHGSIKCPVVGVPRDHTGVLFHAVPLTYMCIHTHTYTQRKHQSGQLAGLKAIYQIGLVTVTCI